MPTIEDLRQRRPRPDTAPGIASFAERNRLLGIPSRIPVGGLEAIPAIGSALLGSIPAGLHGLATLGATRGDTDAAARAVQQLQEALTFQPRTQAGQQAVESAGSTLGALGAPAQAVGSQILRETGSPLAATAGEVLLDPLNFLPGGKVPGTIVDLAATVFHGSPHKFNKFEFSPRTLSTGEGAQAFGAGLYFAENPNVARSYVAAGQASAPTDVKTALWHIQNNAPPTEVSTDGARAAYETLTGNPDFLDMARRAKGDRVLTNEIIDTIGPQIERPGSFYEVDVPDESVDMMLDWDAPLREQPKAIRDSIESAVNRIGKGPDTGFTTDLSGFSEDLERTGLMRWVADEPNANLDKLRDAATRANNKLVSGGFSTQKTIARDLAEDAYIEALNQAQATSGRWVVNPQATGEQIYRALSEAAGGDQMVSKMLGDLGIPGLKFFDAGSRGPEGGTRNLTVWDDSILTTLKRNDEPVAQAAE